MQQYVYNKVVSSSDLILLNTLLDLTVNTINEDEENPSQWMRPRYYTMDEGTDLLDCDSEYSSDFEDADGHGENQTVTKQFKMMKYLVNIKASHSKGKILLNNDVL